MFTNKMEQNGGHLHLTIRAQVLPTGHSTRVNKTAACTRFEKGAAAAAAATARVTTHLAGAKWRRADTTVSSSIMFAHLTLDAPHLVTAACHVASLLASDRRPASRRFSHRQNRPINWCQFPNSSHSSSAFGSI